MTDLWVNSIGSGSSDILVCFYFCFSTTRVINLSVCVKCMYCIRICMFENSECGGFVLVSPARRWSDSRTRLVCPARTSPPAEGWKAWPYDGPWWSRRRPKTRLRGTAAPRMSRNARPGPEARCTPDPRSDAAASTAAHWSSPEIIRRQVWSFKIYLDKYTCKAHYNGDITKQFVCLWTYRHGYLGQVFSNAVLHDTPQIKGVIWFVGNTTASCSS